MTPLVWRSRGKGGPWRDRGEQKTPVELWKNSSWPLGGHRRMICTGKFPAGRKKKNHHHYSHQNYVLRTHRGPVPGTCASYASFHLTFGSRGAMIPHCSHFTGEETEAQGGSITSPRPLPIEWQAGERGQINGFLTIWGLDYFLFCHICYSVYCTLQKHPNALFMFMFPNQSIALCWGLFSLAWKRFHSTVAPLRVLFVIHKVKDTNRRAPAAGGEPLLPPAQSPACWDSHFFFLGC